MNSLRLATWSVGLVDWLGSGRSPVERVPGSPYGPGAARATATAAGRRDRLSPLSRRAGLARCSVALLNAVSLAACELAEVNTAPAEDLLVVESVLRANAPRQSLLLHHSLVGRDVPGEPGAFVGIAGPQGAQTTLQEAPLNSCADRTSGDATDSITVRATCYIAGPQRGIVISPGSTYNLQVVTADGREVRGRTTVPGVFSLRSPRIASPARCALPPGTNLPLVWSVSKGAWSYISEMEISGLRQALQGTGIAAPDRLELIGVAISERDTTLTLPADFGVFSLGDVDQDLLKLLQRGFPAGVTARITIGAADRNYVNAVRGGGFNPSGNVRLSSVIGDGVGLFGSMVPIELLVVVGTQVPLPSCLGY